MMNNLTIRYSDIRDSIIYIFRYCITRKSYAVLTSQDIIMYNIKALSIFDINLFIKEIEETRELYEDTVCPMDKSWLTLSDTLIEELKGRTDET